jgi:hypothetical protein
MSVARSCWVLLVGSLLFAAVVPVAAVAEVLVGVEVLAVALDELVEEAAAGVDNVRLEPSAVVVVESSELVTVVPVPSAVLPLNRADSGSLALPEADDAPPPPP